MSPEIDTATALRRRASGLLVLVVLRCALDRGYPALAPFHPDLISGLQLEGRLVQTSDPNLDGQKMLFERPDRPHTEAEELYIMNADGSGQRRLTRNPARDGGPLWSPDGRQIVFTREWKDGHAEI